MNLFYDEMGLQKPGKYGLRLWTYGRLLKTPPASTHRRLLSFTISFDVVMHLNEALDKVRKSEYARLAGKDRKFIKGQKYTLLSHRENLTIDGEKGVKDALTANKRLNTAYVLKETFGQLWSYTSEAWARKFFDNWKASLKMATAQTV